MIIVRNRLGKVWKRKLTKLSWGYFLKNKQQRHFLNKTSGEGCTRPCFWFRVVAIKNIFPFLKKTRNSLPLKISKNLQNPATFLGRLWHRCFPVNLQHFQEQPFYRIPQGDYCFLTLIQAMKILKHAVKGNYTPNAANWRPYQWSLIK